MKKSILKNAADKSLCIDCIFYYQCRQGKIDCSIRQKLSASKAIGPARL
jgi:hypothetical protein